jgi:hypothetical protein
MKTPVTVKYLDRILPLYTEMVEEFRRQYIIYRVLKKEVQGLKLVNHPVQKAIIYNDLMINFRGGIVTAIMDLSIIIKNLNRTKNKWEKAHYLRQASLLIYESINLYNKHTNIINPVLKSDFPDLYPLFLTQSIKMREFRKEFKHNSELSRIRNNIIGHINDDIFSYGLIVSKIKPTILKKLLVDYLNFLIDMQKTESEIERAMIQNVLDLKGEVLEDYMNLSDDRPKLKIPKMLR